MGWWQKLFGGGSEPKAFDAHAYAHYIIKKGTLNVVVERERLASSLNSSEIRFLLDLSEENAMELLRTGRTTVRNMLGGREEKVTMEGCNCQNMSSHQRGRAAQFQM
jgi:adenine deaminase